MYCASQAAPAYSLDPHTLVTRGMETLGGALGPGLPLEFGNEVRDWWEHAHKHHLLIVLVTGTCVRSLSDTRHIQPSNRTSNPTTQQHAQQHAPNICCMLISVVS